jgi:Fe-S cluster biogenesis protein NfuA
MGVTFVRDVDIHPEQTPNPRTLRFALDRTINERGGKNFPDPFTASGSPLSQRLFRVEGVAAVYVGRDFVTVTKTEALAWTEALVDAIVAAIREHLASGEPAVRGEVSSHAAAAGDIEARIHRILDEEIRPAVAMDGGDIIFLGYHEGVVELHLEGSCSGCPSSLITLKMGIEQRLREEIPEIVDVVAM